MGTDPGTAINEMRSHFSGTGPCFNSTCIPTEGCSRCFIKSELIIVHCVPRRKVRLFGTG